MLTEPAGSTVIINGEEAGKTPLTLTEIEAGDYELTIRKENYKEEVINVTVEPGETASVNKDLTSLKGSIAIMNLTSGAEVYLDGKRVYLQNGRLNDVTAGTCQLVIKKERYVEKKQSITVEPAKTRYVSGKLKKAVFHIPYAKIKIDGKLDDWTGIEPMVTDPVNDNIGGKSGTDIRKIFLAKDDKYIYIRFDLATYESTFNYDHHISLTPIEGGPTVMLISLNGAKEAEILEYLGNNTSPKTRNLGNGYIVRKGNYYEARYSLKPIKRKIPAGVTIKVHGFSTGKIGGENSERINFDVVEETICFLY